MGTRSNACVELVRFWLQTRHGCLVDESVPVPVPNALSDIDLLAIRPDLKPFQATGNLSLDPRHAVETKDEHDWESTGRVFAKELLHDISLMEGRPYVPEGANGVKFTMLREQHFKEAEKRFGTSDFDRLFVVHALDQRVREQVQDELARHRIYWLTIREVVTDIISWYDSQPRPAAIRQSLVGDLLHLLVGFCQLHPVSDSTTFTIPG